MKCTAPILLLALAISGCSPRPTESEFNSLKQADEALLAWVKNVFLALQTGEPISNGDNVKQIMDGAIIKSDLGKKIRANIQATLVLGMSGTQGIGEISEMMKASRAKEAEVKAKGRESEVYLRLNNFDAAERANNEIGPLIKEWEALNAKWEKPAEAIAAKLKEIEPALTKLQEERDQMFKQMRASLEN